jgi:protein tyrosine phosphatase type 4A
MMSATNATEDGVGMTPVVANGATPANNNGNGASTPASLKAHLSTAHQIINRPTFFEFKTSKYLIMDAPTDENLPAYMEVITAKSVHTLVRTCKPTYDKQPLVDAKIEVVELPFKDGAPPPEEVVSAWLAVVKRESKLVDHCVAIHCVAGLGRAPVLVAIALIEAGMDAVDAVGHIRARRRGAFNQSQLKYLYDYKKGSSDSCCSIL